MDAPSLTLNAVPIEGLLRALARMRHVRDLHQQERKGLLRQLEASDRYQALLSSEKAAQEMVDSLTDEIKARAVASFDGANKHPVPGVDIQERTVLTCTDEAAARKYAIEQAPALVQVDMRGLEKLARAVLGTPLELPFYQAATEPAATVAGDLTAYLRDDLPVGESLPAAETLPAEIKLSESDYPF